MIIHFRIRKLHNVGGHVINTATGHILKILTRTIL